MLKLFPTVRYADYFCFFCMNCSIRFVFAAPSVGLRRNFGNFHAKSAIGMPKTHSERRITQKPQNFRGFPSLGFVFAFLHNLTIGIHQYLFVVTPYMQGPTSQVIIVAFSDRRKPRIYCGFCVIRRSECVLGIPMADFA